MFGFGYSRLSAMMQDALRSAWADLKARCPEETVYLFGLYTDSDLLTFCSIVMTEQALLGLGDGSADSRADYRWSLGDSPYIGEFGTEAFRRADRWADETLSRGWHFTDSAKARRLKALERAVQALDAEGLFGSGGLRSRLIVGVFESDHSPKGLIEMARRTNPPEVVDWLIKSLDLPEPRGVAYTTGPSRYSVDDVSVSGDYTLVAGRPSLLFERSQRGRMRALERWVGPSGSACAIAPDGSTAYIAQEQGILRMGLKERRARPELVFATPNAAVALAVSPCGRRIAAEVFEGDLVVVETSGELLLRRTRDRVTFGQRRFAWHPDGARLVFTDGAHLRLVDAQTGAVQWSQPTECRAHAVAVDPTGRWVAFARGVWLGRDEPAPLQVGLLDLEQPEAPPRLSAEFGESEASQIAFSPDGTQLAVACRSLVRILGLDAVQLLEPRRASQESFEALAWLDDEHLVAVGRDVDEGPALVVFSAAADS